jgi:hypothetical protein
MKADNIVTFAYLYNPKALIEYPRHLVTVKNLQTGKQYVYGCFVLPSDDEMLNTILPHLAWIDEEYDLTTNPYVSEKYHITME